MATDTGKDNVIREFNPIGGNRVRLILDPKRGSMLDIREYVNAETFEGFTRRGVRLDVAQLEQLRDIVGEALALARSKADAPRNATAEAAARALRPMVRPEPLITLADPGSPAWESAWGALAAVVGAKSAPCKNCGEDWQYMGTVDGLHEFRHRCGKGCGERDYRKVASLMELAPPAPRIVVRTHSAGPIVASIPLPPQARPTRTTPAPRASILPPALQELKERMRRGETVSPEEFAKAAKSMKPLQ